MAATLRAFRTEYYLWRSDWLKLFGWFAVWILVHLNVFDIMSNQRDHCLWKQPALLRTELSWGVYFRNSTAGKFWSMMNSTHTPQKAVGYQNAKKNMRLTFFRTSWHKKICANAPATYTSTDNSFEIGSDFRLLMWPTRAFPRISVWDKWLCKINELASYAIQFTQMKKVQFVSISSNSSTFHYQFEAQ